MDELFDPISQAQRYHELRRASRDGYARWLHLIKELRVRHACSILEAERIAISNPHRRHWVERRINSNQQCRKYALAHIRYNRDAALIVRKGAAFEFEIPDPSKS